IDQLFGWLFRPFNRAFAAGSERYGHTVARVIRRSAVALLVYLGLIGLTILGFKKVPAGFLTTQDQQYLVAFAPLPDAATLDRTEAVIRKMTEIGLSTPGVQAAVQFPGLSINGFVNSPNAGIVFFPLKPFEERKDKSQYGLAIAGQLNQKLSSIQD